MTSSSFSNQLGLLERRLTADPRAFRESYKAPAILRALGLLDRSGQLTKEGHAARRGGK